MKLLCQFSSHDRGLIIWIQAPPAVDLFGEIRDDALQLADPRASITKAADLIVNGALVEIKLSLYGKVRNFRIVD